MEIEVREENGISIISFEGEVDISVVDSIRTKFRNLIDEKKKGILVDMSKVPYIDSSGLGMFVETMQEMAKYGGEIKLMKMTSDVRKVFELTRLNNFFKIFDEEREAVESFKK
jgi:anti-anti-sigma factor